jgi:hypothetical protein
MEDKEMERNRAAEDEKYHTSLANRAQEDKQRRERQTTEDEYLERIERALDAQAHARPLPPLLQHIELNSVIGDVGNGIMAARRARKGQWGN